MINVPTLETPIRTGEVSVLQSTVNEQFAKYQKFIEAGFTSLHQNKSVYLSFDRHPVVQPHENQPMASPLQAPPPPETKSVIFG